LVISQRKQVEYVAQIAQLARGHESHDCVLGFANVLFVHNIQEVPFII
jgi:hypothetical protein